MWGCGLSALPSGRVPASRPSARPASPRTRPVHLSLHCSGVRLQATRPGNPQPPQPQRRYNQQPSESQQLHRQQQGVREEWRQPESDDAEIKALQSAVDKSYKQKLLELRKVLTPQTIADLRANTPPEQRAELESILLDIQQLDGIDEPALEASVQLTAEESQYIQQAQEGGVLPGTFEEYLQQMFPSYTQAELVQYLDARLLCELEALFVEMKQLETLPDDDMVAKYQELSRRLDQLAMQQSRPGMQPTARQQAQQQQQAQRQRPPTPAPARRRARGPLFKRRAGGSSDSSSSGESS